MVFLFVFPEESVCLLHWASLEAWRDKEPIANRLLRGFCVFFLSFVWFGIFFCFFVFFFVSLAFLFVCCFFVYFVGFCLFFVWGFFVLEFSWEIFHFKLL